MCQSHCFASRDTCFRCGASKLPQSAPPPGAYGAFPYPGGAPAGPYGGPVTMAAVAPVYYVRPPPPRLEGGYGDAVAWGRGPIQDGNYPQRFEVFEYQPHDTVLHLIHNPPAMDSGAPGMGAAPGHSRWVEELGIWLGCGKVYGCYRLCECLAGIGMYFHSYS